MGRLCGRSRDFGLVSLEHLDMADRADWRAVASAHARGAHDAYVQSGPAGMRWDACSSDALVLAAGGAFTDCDGTPIDYKAPDIVNSRGLVATNGRIHGAVVDALRGC